MYDKRVTEASKSALLELGISLKRYREDMVLSGGWAPYFITNAVFAHCGSIDIDFVLRDRIMKKYDSIRKGVLDLGYIQENEFRFTREVVSPVDGDDYPIHIDFLCDKKGLNYAHLRNVQDDLSAFAFDGCDVAFDFNYEQEISTVLPKNGKAKTTVKVLELPGSLALKGHAIDGRAKPKDYYDIYVLTFFNGSPEKAALFFNERLKGVRLPANRMTFIRNSIRILNEKFEDEDSIGPYKVEEFTDSAVMRLDAYRRISTFLKAVNKD
ncbi:MAG: nucleotidyl transferase AbiEii/AbiGii toxin family protein [Candidatus Micrarchaeota archaeon]